MKDKLKFLIALATSIGLVCGAPVSADSPQAGFRGTNIASLDADLTTLADFPSGIGEANKVVGINAAGTAYERKTLTGTANQVTVTHGVGTVTFSAPQDIHTAATPTFAGAILSAALRPNTAAATTVGTSLLPFSSLHVGGAATNNTQITGTVTAARTLTLVDADSNAVRPLTALGSNWVRYIDNTGLQVRSQPAFTDISGVATIANGGTNNGSLGVSAVGIYNGDGTKVVQTTGTANQQFRVNGAGTAIEAFTPSASSTSFTISTKTTNFTASDGANYYYRMTTNDQTVTLPASPADGSVRKFKMVTAAKTATFAFNGAETINHANGTSDQSLTLTSTGGTIELIAVTGGWDET